MWFILIHFGSFFPLLQEGHAIEEVDIFTKLTQRFEKSFFDDMQALKVRENVGQGL